MGQPEVVEVLVGEHLQGVQRRRGAGPRPLALPLGLPVVPEVIQGRQPPGGWPRTRSRHRVRRVGQQLLAQLSELLEGDHPVAVARAVMTTFLHDGISLWCSTSLSTEVWFSATYQLPELATMNATSSALVVRVNRRGGAPFRQDAKSTTTHRGEVPEASATRSSTLIPMQIQPGGDDTGRTRSPTHSRVTLVHHCRCQGVAERFGTGLARHGPEHLGHQRCPVLGHVGPLLVCAGLPCHGLGPHRLPVAECRQARIPIQFEIVREDPPAVQCSDSSRQARRSPDRTISSSRRGHCALTDVRSFCRR